MPLGVTFTPDLCLEKHASIVSARCFSATPVHRVRRSLDLDAALTRLYSFASCRVDYCNCLMAGRSTQDVDRQSPTCHERCQPRSTIDEEVRQDGGGGLSRILHDEIHCLEVSERVPFTLCVHIYTCMGGIELKYMVDISRPVSAIEDVVVCGQRCEDYLKYRVQNCRLTGEWPLIRWSINMELIAQLH